jgi:uncharacterized membrane protein
MTSIPAEFYALVNAFLFALHNMFTKKALRYSNPATAVISGLLINIYFSLGPVDFIRAGGVIDQRFDFDLCCGWPVSARAHAPA